jgi:formate-dependent nitrite reductase membrane component NrfD
MTNDGRFIDTGLGLLEGEAATVGQAHGLPMRATPQTPYPAPGPTYYGRPFLKEPVWEWSVPAYFLIGGIAGAAMTLGMAAQFIGGRSLYAFDERCRWTGAIGGAVGSALLIYDLGRPTRFLAMLRVFRATSPMSIGSWVLALATPLSAGSAILPRPYNRLLGIGAGLLGMPLATYTGVLIASTAVPLWNSARRGLPLLFGASSMVSLAALFQFLDLDRRERAIVHRFGLLGQVAELAAHAAVEREVSRIPQVSRPLHDGFSGVLWNAASVFNAATLVVSLAPGGGRRKRWLAGALGLASGVCVRFGIFYAGKRSARDPHAAFAHAS